MQSRMAKRLQKDLEQIQKAYADQFNVRMPNNDIKHWIVGFEGAKGTLYQEEKFELQFKFSNEYVEVLYSYLALFPFENSQLNHLKSFLLVKHLNMNIFIRMDSFVYQYYLMNGLLPQLYHLCVSQSNPCYQVLQKK